MVGFSHFTAMAVAILASNKVITNHFISNRREYRRLRQAMLHQSKKDKKAFGGMFARGSLNDSRSEHREVINDVQRRNKSLDKVLEDAESMLNFYKSVGHGREDEQHEMRQIVNDLKMKKLDLQKYKGAHKLNFRQPPPEMIADAASRGVDLTNPRVIELLEKMQSEKYGEHEPFSTIGLPAHSRLFQVPYKNVCNKHVYLKILQMFRISLLLVSICKAFTYLMGKEDFHINGEGSCLGSFFKT